MLLLCLSERLCRPAECTHRSPASLGVGLKQATLPICKEAHRIKSLLEGSGQTFWDSAVRLRSLKACSRFGNHSQHFMDRPANSQVSSLHLALLSRSCLASSNSSSVPMSSFDTARKE